MNTTHQELKSNIVNLFQFLKTQIPRFNAALKEDHQLTVKTVLIWYVIMQVALLPFVFLKALPAFSILRALGAGNQAVSAVLYTLLGPLYATIGLVVVTVGLGFWIKNETQNFSWDKWFETYFIALWPMYLLSLIKLLAPSMALLAGLALVAASFYALFVSTAAKFQFKSENSKEATKWIIVVVALIYLGFILVPLGYL